MGEQHVMGSQVFDYWFDTSGFVVVRSTLSEERCTQKADLL